ncbi:tetratricopeptide repeat protein [Pseudoxanthomonas sp. LjRoot143]|uniref:tetratricopeptide repeat protein n=1 Tax=Pseudoxanthomonas sp. LjRoot143 TaxID=3342266 RepID=UPI003F502852
MLDSVMKSLQSPGALYASGHYEQAFAEVKEIWDGLPRTKLEEPNAYMVIEYAVAILLRLGRLDEAHTWAERSLDFREKRHDLGEAEFLIAKVAYEQGNLEEARQLISIASRKSDGRILQGEDPKYRALVRNPAEG